MPAIVGREDTSGCTIFPGDVAGYDDTTGSIFFFNTGIELTSLLSRCPSHPRFGSTQSRYISYGSTHSSDAPVGPAWLYSYPKQHSVLSPYTSLEYHYLDPQTLPLQFVAVSLEVSI